MHRRIPRIPVGRIVLALSLLGLLTRTDALAGPLEPPSGPVAPTYKTLTEVEPRTPISSLPFIIHEPGSYYVTGNLTSADGPGIVINAPNVTLDLMGHTLTGADGSSSAIISTVLGVNPTVKNGRVTGWGTTAISVTGARLFDLEAAENANVGFSIGSGSVVGRCIARSNGSHGFVGSLQNTIESCTSQDNSGHGFSLGTTNTVRFCTANANASSGFDTGSFCTLHECTSSVNTLDGFHAGSSSRLDRCVAARNGRHGISVATFCSVLNCTAAQQTEGSGILVSNSGAVVQGCFAWGNINGIDVTGNSARIEGNTSLNNTRGFNVAGTSNLIIRNAADNNNANYFIVANNVVGVTVQAPLSAAIAGSSGGAGVGTTNPWANFSY